MFSRIWAGERRRSDGDPWGAIERSRSESRRGVTRRGDRELKPSDWPAVHGPPAAAPGFQGASALWRAGVRGWRGPSPGNAARGTPSPACPCGWRPGLFRPCRVDRPPRLAVDGLDAPETDSDGRPSADARQLVRLGPRGGDEALELGRARRRGPRLERAAVAARLVLDDDRRAERLLEGLGQAALLALI